MEKNVGSLDRTIRILVGLIILTAEVIFKTWWGLIGIIPLFTGLIGWCGLYSLLGISTVKSSKK
jgi:hypothetical protein